jgi:hypothetical protein
VARALAASTLGAAAQGPGLDENMQEIHWGVIYPADAIFDAPEPISGS